MSSRTLCSRHGFMAYTRASQAVATRINERGQFESGEIAKVSLDRPRRQYTVWMHQSEIEAHAATVTRRDHVCHVEAFPEIAALERLLVWVCPACLDELLVRSGEQPTTPTSLQQALDKSVVAAGAEVSDNIIQCGVHGLVFPTRSSFEIADAIDKQGILQLDRLVKVVVPSALNQSVFWFDVDFLTEKLEWDVKHAPAEIRLEERSVVDKILFAGVRVCRRCLADLLKRSAANSK